MASRFREEQGQANREWGQEAEQIAADYFLTEGYTIRERNWRSGRAEVDLILEKDRTIVFVEVKARRGDRQDPADAVDRKKRLSMMRAADSYLSRLPILYQYRFDIFTVTGDRDNHRQTHYQDAFLSAVNAGRR